MSKQLHPICFHINDREEMVNQMFSTMKEDKLRAMLPPILKGMPVDELKKFCLEELLGMSSKRIQSVVAGRELLSSSDSEDADMSASDDEDSASVEESDSDSDNEQPAKSRHISKDQRAENALQTATGWEDVEESSKARKHGADRLKHSHKATEPVTKPKKMKHAQKPEEAATANAQPEKTLLDMLELELRARAIRAALTHQEKISLVDNREGADTGIVIEIKEESEKTSGEEPSGNISVIIQESTSEVEPGKANSSAPIQTDDSLQMISSDEAIPGDSDDHDDGEPVVIEPVVESIVISSDSEPEKPEEKQESWKERWMQKKDIATVMKASKLITSVKQKMKRKKTDKLALVQTGQVGQEQRQEKTNPAAAVIQGTVSEFNMLPPATTTLASPDNTEQPVITEHSFMQQPVTVKAPVQQSSIEETALQQLISEEIPIVQAVCDVLQNPQQLSEQHQVESISVGQTTSCKDEAASAVDCKQAADSAPPSEVSAVQSTTTGHERGTTGTVTTDAASGVEKTDHVEIPPTAHKQLGTVKESENSDAVLLSEAKQDNWPAVKTSDEGLGAGTCSSAPVTFGKEVLKQKKPKKVKREKKKKRDKSTKSKEKKIQSSITKVYCK